jgi:hypothetical protein
MIKGYNFLKVTGTKERMEKANNVSIIKFLKLIKNKKLESKIYQVDGIEKLLKEESEDICRKVFSENIDYIMNNVIIVRFDINENISNWNNVDGFKYSNKQVNMKEIFGSSFRRIDTRHWCANFNVDS